MPFKIPSFISGNNLKTNTSNNNNDSDDKNSDYDIALSGGGGGVTNNYTNTAASSSSSLNHYYTDTNMIKKSSDIQLMGGGGGGNKNNEYDPGGGSFNRERIFKRTTAACIIEEEPDSIDSLISNPSSFPITIIPTTSSSLIRSATQASMGKYSRQGSTRSRGVRPGSVRKVRRRAVLKNGECNVIQKKISQRRIRFLQDIFTTLVDSQWRWTLLAFALSFILSWLAFAVIWWLIAFTHGDLEEQHLPPNQAESNWTPCVFNIYSFTSCFLFSIETQHTIGYGVRTTTEECPEAIFVMCFQSIYGVMVQAFMVGIVFAKMTRPKQRTQTLLFSKNAVICQRDSELTLMFRVGDMRKSHIIGASIRAQLIRTRQTKEGEILSQYQSELEIGTDGCSSDLFFIWPMIVVHRITSASPFYLMSASDMLQDKFEIVVILEGTVESTGQTTQARSSYLNMEILWGYRFDPVVGYNKDRQGYEIDYSKFNETTQVDTPLCSAKELAEFYKAQDDYRSTDFQFFQSPILSHKRYPIFNYNNNNINNNQHNNNNNGNNLMNASVNLSQQTHQTIQNIQQHQTNNENKEKRSQSHQQISTSIDQQQQQQQQPQQNVKDDGNKLNSHLFDSDSESAKTHPGFV